MRSLFLAALIVSIVCTAIVAGGQSPPAGAIQSPPAGALNGTVQDQGGAPIPGVTVTAREVSTGAATTVMTNESGAYTFPNLPRGTYTVSASLLGFAVETRTGVTLGPQPVGGLKFILKILRGSFGGPLPSPFPSPPSSRDREVDIRADSQTTQGAVTLYRGHVQMTTDSVVISADELDYNSQTQKADARGSVSVQVLPKAPQYRQLAVQ